MAQQPRRNHAALPTHLPRYERLIDIEYRACPCCGEVLHPIGGDRSEQPNIVPTQLRARINPAIRWIRQHFAEPLRVEALAAIVAMSPSAFHRHFKRATALSPVKFQRRIRLLQARLLLISGGLKASDVAFDFVCESAPQFSREYARFFGAPSARDAARIFRHLQQAGSAEMAA